MKKRLLNTLILLGMILIMIPIYIGAESYSEAENIVKNYMEKNEFKNSYSKYLYTNGANNLSGMISKKEFEITRYDEEKNYRNINYSYLWDSNPFWSSTVENGKNIPIRDNYEILPGDEQVVGTKVTQYINNNTGVYGSGTYSDPWLFAPQYKVRIKVNDNTKGNITNESYSRAEEDLKDQFEFVYIAGSGLQKVYINSIGANEYLGSTCGYIVNGINANDKHVDEIGVGGYLLISDITRDTECMINFGERPRVIKLDQSYNDLEKSDPEVLYMSPEKGWYNDKYGNNQIVQIEKNPKRLGYNFKGYYKSSNKDNACSGSIVIDNTKKLYTTQSLLNQLENNSTIYACYEPITYYVAYNCPNGTAKANNTRVEHIYNVSKKLESDRCTRIGYDLTSWNTQENGTGESYGKDEEVQGIYDKHGETLNLYAQWTPKTNIKYVVNHYIQNINNDEYSFKEADTKENGTADASKTFTPNTYEGFTSPSNQTVTIKPDGSTVVNFYYTRNSYKISFDANDHGTPEPTYYTLKYQANYKLPSISAKGYTLKGWFTEKNSGTEITTSKIVEKAYDHTLYAKWEAKKYIVKHSCGTGSGTVSNITATFDTIFTSASNTCTKRGYTQSGWTTNSNESNDDYGWSNWSGKWTFDNGEYGITNGTLQLYPQWKANTYTVKYSCGTTATQTATFNSSFTVASNTCTKKGYTQIGWTTNSNGNDDGHGWSNWSGTWTYVNGQYGISNGKLQLYPRWQANTYTIKYSCGTGTGSVSSQSVKYDTNVTIAKSGCVKNGYAFAGWTTRSDETNDGHNWTGWSGTWVYDNGQYGINNRTLQLYPMWTQCQAGYYSNNGTCQKCSEGTYSNAGASSCPTCPTGSYCSGGTRYSCPSGYTSNSGAKIIDECYISVSAGKYIANAGDPTQTNCAKGTISEKHTVYYGKTSSCTTCAAGTYNTAAGSTTCSACPKGKYCTGGTNQTNCPAGKYRNATGGKTANDCTNCTAGSMSAAGAATCTTCAAGTYNTTAGSTSCSACPKGKYCTGGTNQTNCPAGKYRNATGGKTSSDCTNCTAGSMSAAGAATCTTCAAGTYNTTAGSTSCSACPKGKYCTGGTNQTNCPANTYRSTTGGKTLSDCTACPSGQTSSAGAASCASCAAGTYLPSGGTSCVTCPKGKYCTGGTNIANCPAGKYRNATGGKSASDCSTCAAGSMSAAGAATCTTCAAGTYNTTAGSTSCSACPKGKYCTGGTNQTNCPANTYRSTTGGKVLSDCTSCGTGKTSPAGSDALSDCVTQQVTYTATFNKNGASSIGSTTKQCTADYGKTCTVTAPTISAASGFTALGWNTSSDATTSSVAAGGTITLSANKTYYAITKSTATKTATFYLTDSYGTKLTTMSSTYTSNYGNTYKSVTCYKYNGASSYTCIAPGEINLYNRTDKSGYSFEEKLLTFNGWSTTADNTADYAVGAKISITANTTFYSATSLKDKYYSNSIFGADLGTGVLYTLSSSGAYKEGVDLGHRMKATAWKYYTGRTGCTNYVWLYGYSLDETWSQNGYACSYYMGLKKLSAA